MVLGLIDESVPDRRDIYVMALVDVRADVEGLRARLAAALAPVTPPSQVDW